MPTYERGSLTTVGRPSDQLVKDMTKLYELEMEATPLISITAKLNKSEPAENPRFDIQELRAMAQTTTCNSYLVGATSIVVADGSLFNANDRIVNLRTFENMLVTAVDTGTNTLTVTRAVGTTSAAAGNNNDEIVRIGQANSEFSSIGSMALRAEDHLYNYTQIFREPYEISGTLLATKNYSGDQKRIKQRSAARKIKGDIEFAAIFGERYISGSRRGSAGLKPWITTNTYNPAGTLTETAFATNVLVPAGRYGRSEKLFFCGENLLRCLHHYGQQKMNIFQEDNTLGFKCMRYRSPFVDLLVIRHPLFRTTATAQMGLIVDPDNFKRRPLRGRDLRLLENRENNDVDGIKGEFMAELGFEVSLEETHMFINGVTGPA